MKIGDLVKHRYGTMQGSGIVLSIRNADGGRAVTVWTAYGQTRIQDVATLYLEVISESR